MIKAFPKIFTIGTDYINNLFSSEVEITEKIDGSQFDFGKLEGELYMRSKGAQIFAEAPDKMFLNAVNFITTNQANLPDNTIFYCEYLKTPKHNVLKYDRVPLNYLILFGVANGYEKFISKHSEIIDYAKEINIEAVPLIFSGIVSDIAILQSFLETKSILGGTTIEGIVAKNYSIPFLLNGQPIALMAGKFVSEKFKEINRTNWKGEFTSRGRWELFVESFRTEARWQKAIQHLTEIGKLENAPKDIGNLIKEIQSDIESEEKENIKNHLWNEFKGDILRKAIAGFPEWYKTKLLERAIA